MTTVAMDSSGLMAPVEVGVRIFEELDRLLGEWDCVVPEAVVAELESLSGGASQEATAASVAADLAERCRTVGHEQSYADDALVELVGTGVADAVLTNDAALTERLHEAGVPVINLRGRNQLAYTQP
jgi:hypothetical protein